MARKPGGGHMDDPPAPAGGKAYYELDETVDEYLAFHYPGGDPLADLAGDGVPGLDARYPFALRRFWQPARGGLALDAGAATGRVTFDLARDHDAAVGVDLSKALVRAAARVRATGRARYRLPVEGRLFDSRDIAVPGVARNAHFAPADALRLPFSDETFATVVALNLLDRVPDPARALAELARVTAPGGRLVVGSPFTWLATFTPEERWLGGFERDGAPVRGADAVRARLEAAGFVHRSTERLLFFIPQHARSGQLAVSIVQVLDLER